MSVTLTKVSRDDLPALFRLTVTPDQRPFVAPNEITLAQAPYEGGASVHCIRAEGEIVGLLAEIDFRAHPHLEPHDHPEAALLWRLMIGADHQGRGHGRAAVALFLEAARRRGHPVADTSVVEGNARARAFYESLGFRPTGAVAGGEVILRMPLGA